MRSRALQGSIALAILAGAAVGTTPNDARASAAAPEKVLILSGTVSGSPSIEAASAAALGYAVEVASDAQWSAKTTADFSTYRALILGDPRCSSSPSTVAAATGNAATWGPAVNGNVILIGTDPVWHGKSVVTEKGIAFATSQMGKTGAYITLSCYYHGAAPGTAVPLLDGIRPGAFTVSGVGCHNDAHIVATHPALEGLTDATLSNWSCSVHEGFDSWPADFTVLALARAVGTSFTATDGTVGTPYILASGDGLASVGLSLTPSSATVPAGSAHTVTAQLVQGGVALTERRVMFAVTAGPDVGASGTCNVAGCLTAADGTVSWTFTNRGTLGDDTVTAFADSNANGVADAGEPRTTALARVVVPPNTPTFVDPTPAAGSVLEVNLGSPIGWTIKASDPNPGDTVTLGAPSKPAGATFTSSVGNPATGTFSWTPTTGADTTATFTATDSSGLAAAPRTVTIHVNDPPRFAAPTPASGSTLPGPIDVGQTVTFGVKATDADGDTVDIVDIQGLGGTATIARAPEKNEFDVSWPAPAPGTYSVVVLTSDRPAGTPGRFVSRRSFKILVRTATTLTATPAVAEAPPSVTQNIDVSNGQPTGGVMVAGIWFRYLAAQLKTDAGTPVAGRIVEFDVGGTTRKATTGADGWAVLEDPAMAIGAVGNGSYTATFAGDTLFKQSADSPGLLGGVPPPA